MARYVVSPFEKIIDVSLTNPITLADVKLEQAYRLRSDPNVIDDGGVDAIRRFVGAVNVRNPEWFSLVPAGYDVYGYNDGNRCFLPKFPDDWVWKNNLTGKTADTAVYGQGKFAKRYANFVRKTIGLNLPVKFIQDLGLLAGRHSESSSGFVFRFVSKFDWNSGDFGDGSSCFWGGRETARTIMVANGAWAVQFFDPSTAETPSPSGIGRAWCVPDYPHKGLITLFNGYGDRVGGEPLRVMARCLAQMLGHDMYKIIALRNNNSETGVLYMNSGRGIVVGDIKASVILERYDLKWPEKILGMCRHYNTPIYDNEPYQHYNGYYYSERAVEDFLKLDGHTNSYYDVVHDGEMKAWKKDRVGKWREIDICTETYNRYFTTCSHCKRVILKGEIQFIESEGVFICTSCESEAVFQCPNCDTLHLKEYGVHIHGSKHLTCPVCVFDMAQ